MRFCFTPASDTYSEITARVPHNSCTQPEQTLILRGVGYETTGQVLGPILRLEFTPTDFDTTLCGTTKCRDVTFRNIGDTTLTVHSADAILQPFTGTIPVPFQLAQNGSRTFNICYRPPTAPSSDSQIVNLVADTRVPLSVGMLFDVSGSMTADISPGVTRIEAANLAGSTFIGGLLDTPEIRDEAGIFSFEEAPNFATLQTFTSNKPNLVAALPTTAPGARTCIYDGLIKTISAVRQRSNHRVIILLTDGADSGPSSCGPATVASVVSQAVTDNVRIFTVGIGSASATNLTSIANGTGGQFFTAATNTDLIGVYRQIATLLSSRQNLELVLRGRGVTPLLSLLPVSVNFDSVRIGDTRCVPVTVSNTGDAPLRIAAITGGGTQFSSGTPPVDAILPGAQAVIDVCFTPDRLRIQTNSLLFSHNSCSQPDIGLPLTGIGWDSVTITLLGTYMAKPGSDFHVFIPVRLTDPLPAEYLVSRFTLKVRYNKTLLDPLTLPGGIVQQNTLSSLLPGAAVNTTFDPSNALSVYTVSGSVFQNPVSDSVLVKLGYQVLLGNSIETPVELIGATFEDGNPRVGILQPGRVILDSICYLDQRLIDASGSTFDKLTQNVPNPFNPSTTIRYSISQPVHTRLIVYDALGREIRVLVDGVRLPGEYETVFDGGNLSSGLYFYRLEAGSFTAVRKMLLSR